MGEHEPAMPSLLVLDLDVVPEHVRPDRLIPCRGLRALQFRDPSLHLRRRLRAEAARIDGAELLDTACTPARAGELDDRDCLTPPSSTGEVREAAQCGGAATHDSL